MIKTKTLMLFDCNCYYIFKALKTKVKTIILKIKFIKKKPSKSLSAHTSKYTVDTPPETHK